jgi:hypothetical protein
MISFSICIQIELKSKPRRAQTYETVGRNIPRLAIATEDAVMFA